MQKDREKYVSHGPTSRCPADAERGETVEGEAPAAGTKGRHHPRIQLDDLGSRKINRDLADRLSDTPAGDKPPGPDRPERRRKRQAHLCLASQCSFKLLTLAVGSLQPGQTSLRDSCFALSVEVPPFAACSFAAFFALSDKSTEKQGRAVRQSVGAEGPELRARRERRSRAKRARRPTRDGQRWAEGE